MPLKALFGLGDLEHSEDFASLIAVSFSILLQRYHTVDFISPPPHSPGTAFAVAGQKLGS